MEQRVFWHDTLPFPPAVTAREWPSRVEVAVIGGGYTGLSAARTLARAGVRVAVLEAEYPGWGASSRNGGMALSGFKLGLTTLRQRYGSERTRELFTFSLNALDYVENLVQEEAIACDFRRWGALIVASKPGHRRFLEEEASLAMDFGYHLHYLEREELKAEIGSEIYHGGLVDEGGAGLNPAQYVSGLTAAAERHGVHIYPQTRLQRVEREDGAFRLFTSRGELRAERVFIATAGYTGNLIPWLETRILPVGSYIIATEPLSEAQRARLIPRQRMVFDTRHYLNYFRFSADGRLLFGGRAVFFPESPRLLRQSLHVLRQEMRHVFPELRSVRIDYVWGGTLDFPLDLMPHVGEQDGLAFALGYAGHGVVLGTYLGHTAAEALLKDEIQQHPCAAFPFPALPFAAAKRALLPLAGLWYRFLDWVS